MANVIRIKRKTTTGAPALGSLQVGEFCLVIPDNTLYIKKDAGTLLSYDYDLGGGGGDMVAATYDPGSVQADAFAMDNMVEGTTTKIMTDTERTKLAGIETGADVTDATNVDAAGATMNTDTSVAGNGWVLDEDNFISNSDTQVPTQQSTKVYVDTAINNLVASAPGTLDTLNELAAALGDDPNFATTVTTSLGTKLDANSTVDGGEITV